MLGSRIGGTGAGHGPRTAAHLKHQRRSEPAVPGINEVWSLVSGTRSNPPHSPDYGADYSQGGYADLTGGQTGGYAGAPYSGTEGSSEAAEYYYEDQYSQQQYQYTEYDPQGQYAESSADHYQQ